MATLSHFGISGSSGVREGLGILMPKLKYRFRVTFSGGGFGTTAVNRQIIAPGVSAPSGASGNQYMTQQVVTSGRPNLQHNRTALHSYNNIMYIPQKPEWQNIEVVLRDDLSNLATQQIGQQLKAQMNHYDQTSARAGTDFKFVTRLETLDGSHVNSPVEVWVLEGCFIETVAYDNFDYSSSDPVQITLTLSYDNATQTGLGGATFTAGADGLSSNETPLAGQ